MKNKNDHYDQCKHKLENSKESKYKTIVFGLAVSKLTCEKVVEATLPVIIESPDFCPKELGISLGTFYKETEIVKVFLHEERKHLLEPVLIGLEIDLDNIISGSLEEAQA